MSIELLPSGQALPLPYPTYQSEFEVQAWLFSTLRAAGLDVRGEVRVEIKRRERVRFDLVLFDKNKAPKLVVEVKRQGRRITPAVADTRQGRRYIRFGVPVRFICGPKQAEEFAAELGAIPA